MAYTPTVAVDFDGVLHSYTSGWTGPEPIDPPEPGAVEFIHALQASGYKVVIYTTRAETSTGWKATMDWLGKYGFPFGLTVTDAKPKAIAYVDDRAVPFHRQYYGFQSVLDDVNKLRNNGPHHVMEDRYIPDE